MPSYRTHDKAAIIAAPVLITGIAQITTLDIAIGMGIGFLLANHYLSPDLDIDSIMNRRWGVLYFIWYPYKRMFSHRSFWTHSGPISATIRFIYLGVWLAPLLYIVQPPLLVLAAIYMSIVLADSLHTLLDKIL